MLPDVLASDSTDNCAKCCCGPIPTDDENSLADSADPAFRGDPARWNPEQLLVAALAQCHMPWLLGLTANAGVVVTGYVDHVLPITMRIDHPQRTAGGTRCEVVSFGRIDHLGRGGYVPRLALHQTPVPRGCVETHFAREFI